MKLQVHPRFKDSPCYINSVVACPNGILLSGSGVGDSLATHPSSIRKTHLAFGKDEQTIMDPHSKSITSLVYNNANSEIFASASKDQSVILWDFQNFTPIHSFSKIHNGSIFSIDISQNGYNLVTSSSDMSIKLFDLRMPEKELLYLPNFHSNTIYDITFTKNLGKNSFFSAGEDGFIYYYDILQNKKLVFQQWTNKQILSMKCSKNFLCCGTTKGEAFLYDISAFKFDSNLINAPQQESMLIEEENLKQASSPPVLKENIIHQ